MIEAFNVETKYDQVAVKVSEGGYNLLTVQDWQRMDILKRIELMKEGRITFLLNGKIATLEA